MRTLSYVAKPCLSVDGGERTQVINVIVCYVKALSGGCKNMFEREIALIFLKSGMLQ